MKTQFKQDKGQAGLTIMLSVIVMLFVVGLLIMIFSLMGTSLRDSTYTDDVSRFVANESVARPTTAGVTLFGNTQRNGVCGAITNVMNGTTGDVVIALGNFTQTGCTVRNASVLTSYGTTLRFTYTYTYSADNTATNVMNDTTTSIATTTDWFNIFIVITAMVVLILLTVIIITAIRSSGMVAGASTGANTVGTA